MDLGRREPAQTIGRTGHAQEQQPGQEQWEALAIMAPTARPAPNTPTAKPRVIPQRRPKRFITAPIARAAAAVPTCCAAAGTPAQAGSPISCAPTIALTVPLTMNAADTRLCVATSTVVIFVAMRE